MIFETVDVEPRLPNLGKDSSFFLQRINDTNLLFIFEAELTSLLALRTEGNKLILDCVKEITSQRSIHKITGNNNCILMLDVEGELFCLQGKLENITETFNITNAKKFLTVDGILSWQNQQQLTGCLAMTGITNAVSFLYSDGSVYEALYSSDDLKNGLSKISCNMLSEFIPGWKYFNIQLIGETAKIIGERIIKSLTPPKEVLLVIEPSQLMFLAPTPDGQIISQPYQIDFQTDIVNNVMSFEKKRWLLIVCESGKLVCLKFDNSTKSFQSRHAWLTKSVSGVVGYEDDVIYLLWSDLKKLYLSTLGDDNVIRNIKIFCNMKHVKHLVKIDSKIVMITMDGCVYQTEIHSVPHQEMKFPTSELLNKMFQTSKITNTLTKEIVAKEHLIEALNISRKHNISKNINIITKEGLIVLENKSEYLFRKGLWRLWLERKGFQRKNFEMKELENDILPGGRISIKCDENIPNSIILVCDILGKATGIVLKFKCEKNFDEIGNCYGPLQDFLKDKCNFIA